MAQNEVDVIDVAALMVIPMVAGIIFGVFSLSVELGLGFSLVDSLVTIGGTGVTYAIAIYAVALGWIVLTNEIDGSDYEGFEYGIIVAALVGPIVYEFVPAVADLVHYHWALQLGAVMLTAAASVYISYTE